MTKQNVHTIAGMTVYLLAAGTLAGAWANPWGFALWFLVFVGLLLMMHLEAHPAAEVLTAAVLLAAPWLAGLWR